MSWGVNPYEQGSKVIDCGDVRFNFFFLFLLIFGFKSFVIRCLLVPMTMRWL